MGRWEPNAQLRLVHAAVDLFIEQGYAPTTVAQIAERAGLTKTTFFRHFPDKREVLFAGQDSHGRLLAEGIAAAPEGATPLEAVAAALDIVTASFTPEQREFGPRLQAAVAADDDLRERSAFKHAGLVEVMSDALQKRGLAEPTATIAAEIGVHAFHRSFARWVRPANEQSYTELAREALDELEAATATLGGVLSPGPRRRGR